MNCPRLMPSLILTLGLAMYAQDATAQGLIEACYVSNTGVIYRIDPSGDLPGNLPTGCRATDRHILFSWVDADGADHNALANLGVGDPHTQYVPVDGSRGMTGSLQLFDHKDGTLEVKIWNRSTSPSSAERLSFSNEDGDLAGIKAWDKASIRPNVMDIFNNRNKGSIRLHTEGVPRFTVANNGNVGIGTTTPGEMLSVAGVVESKAGGFKFPDGTTQTTASTGLSGIRILSQTNDVPAGKDNASIALYCHDAGSIVSGGYRWAGPGGHTWAAFPDPSVEYGHRYVVQLSNPTDAALRVWVYAVCVK